jgi:hypothetical protein
LHQVLLSALLLWLEVFQDTLVELGLLGDLEGQEILHLFLARGGTLRRSHRDQILNGLI